MTIFMQLNDSIRTGKEPSIHSGCPVEEFRAKQKRIGKPKEQKPKQSQFGTQSNFGGPDIVVSTVNNDRHPFWACQAS